MATRKIVLRKDIIPSFLAADCTPLLVVECGRIVELSLLKEMVCVNNKSGCSDSGHRIPLDLFTGEDIPPEEQTMLSVPNPYRFSHLRNALFLPSIVMEFRFYWSLQVVDSILNLLSIRLSIKSYKESTRNLPEGKWIKSGPLGDRIRVLKFLGNDIRPYHQHVKLNQKKL